MDELIARVAGLAAVFQARAAALDQAAAFPSANLEDLRAAGALAAVLPIDLGGRGWCAVPHTLRTLLRLIGRGHLATGRLFEGHVNAVRLVADYGSAPQLAGMAAAIRDGALFGLWVTDGPDPLRIDQGRLAGGKLFCSGAGYLEHAVVTARPAEGEALLALVQLDSRARATPSAVRLQGMRAAVTGAVDFSLLPAEIVGRPGDYLRQPLFSAGAWRTSAVALGGIDALVEAAQAALAARRRADDAHQLARMGAALIARESAALWVEKAARIAETPAAESAAVTAYVNLARIAVERAALEVIALVQRSLGLAAFVQGDPAEALMRDLATYLRQPAPDETLTEAAAWFSTHALPA